MAKLFAPLYLLLAVFVFTSVRRMVPMVNADECSLASIGGGCPDEDECTMTCITCYRNVGHVRSYCRSGGEGIPFDSCICVMSDGAPCNPIGPPKCPNWPRSISAAANFTAN
ncbi:PREDICTED: MTR_3g105840 [Prunus dulcis]|uniref:PREDICTED: MTR_3g105840 n=2 Tax=Prunus dulcis TaxID=3755 RepID=A0A5E4F0L3_PRUDU|nr:hypothetical protein L3X38_000631 [Prunus dulcis]VVA20940.1 PREDICTED: MTR_3g105840 [Prunus dulcis]